MQRTIIKNLLVSILCVFSFLFGWLLQRDSSVIPNKNVSQVNWVLASVVVVVVVDKLPTKWCYPSILKVSLEHLHAESEKFKLIDLDVTMIINPDDCQKRQVTKMYLQWSHSLMRSATDLPLNVKLLRSPLILLVEVIIVIITRPQ